VHGTFLPSALNTDVIPIFFPNNPGISVLLLINVCFKVYFFRSPLLGRNPTHRRVNNEYKKAGFKRFLLFASANLRTFYGHTKKISAFLNNYLPYQFICYV
jgi:hypothetical protein